MTRYRESFFESHDGIRLYRRSWDAKGRGEGAPRGIVILIHGFGDHVGRFRFVVKYLREHGFRVEGFDCRGHGQSGGPRGHIDSFAQYLQDLDLFLGLVERSSDDASLPMFLMGHSQGGHVALRYGIDYGDRPLRGVITSSPFLGLSVKVPFSKLLAAHLSSKLWPSLAQPTGLQEEDLTHEQEVIDETRRDPLYGRVATSRWLTSTMDSIQDTLRRAYLFRLPLLMQQAGDERIVDKHAAVRFFEQSSSRERRRVEYPGYLHEIYNETPDRRSSVFADLGSWLDERLASP